MIHFVCLPSVMVLQRLMLVLDSETYTNFYNTYCPATRDCMISESGAAYHVDIAGGASQLDIQRAWWQDCITNTTFTNLFPQIKATFMFEHQKVSNLFPVTAIVLTSLDQTEFDGGVPDLRDFRITNDSIIAAAFQADLEAMPGMFTWLVYNLAGNRARLN